MREVSGLWMISERASRFVFFIETVLFTAPAAVACALLAILALIELGLPLVDSSLAVWRSDFDYAVFASTTIVGALIGLCAVVVAVCLTVIFLRSGSKGLMRVPQSCWLLAYLGALMSTIGLFCFVYRFLNQDLMIPAYFAFGFPMIIPLAHLRWELRRRSGSSAHKA